MLTACGAPGPPAPPSLELARPVTDLHATRKGDKVILAWTVPAQTTDYLIVRHLGPTRVCRNLQIAANQCGVPVAELPAPQLPRIRHQRGKKDTSGPPIQATYTDILPPDLVRPDAFSTASYAVEVLNENNRSAGLSNQVDVALAPTLPAPRELHAQVTADGVVLSWAGTLPATDIPGINYVYRVYRRPVDTSADAVAGEVALGSSSQGTLVDHTFEWQKTYDYRVTAVTVIPASDRPANQIEGDDSTPVRVFVNDVFPPAVPGGLQAVSSGVGQQPFIDLTWAPDTEADLAGYNVYRQGENGESRKMNTDLVKTPAYRDASVEPGKHYTYSVSAVDLRNNESGRSEEAGETVP